MTIISSGIREAAAVRPEAAVAIIRCSRPEASVLLLRRNRRSGDPWSGHFAFPGGRCEKQDTSLYATCIRETYEETGVLLKDEALQYILPPTPAGRNVQTPILVQPYFFRLVDRPSVTVEPAEIESFLWLDLELFKDMQQHISAEVLPDHFHPAFPLDDYYLWGFTYKLLRSVLELSEF